MAPENKLVAIRSFREARRWTCRSPRRGGHRERESPTRDRFRIFSPGRAGSANPQTAPIGGRVDEGDFGPRLTADGALGPTGNRKSANHGLLLSAVLLGKSKRGTHRGKASSCASSVKALSKARQSLAILRVSPVRCALPMKPSRISGSRQFRRGGCYTCRGYLDPTAPVSPR
jgi:hypothetical protein